MPSEESGRDQGKVSQERFHIGDYPHREGLTRGTLIEYDDWQWCIVTELALDRDPPKVGFVLLDQVGDGPIPELEEAWGCWEHYQAVEQYRGSHHEFWTSIEYVLNDDVWTVIGPIHLKERDEKIVTDGGRDRVEHPDGREQGSVNQLSAQMELSHWREKATENVEEWGLQDVETLLLAMQEEQGELAQAFLESEHEDGDAARIASELDDLAALCIQLRWRLESL